MELVCKDECVGQMKRLLDGRNRLSRAKLFQCLGKAMSQALAKPMLWKKYSQLQRVTVKDITAGSRTISSLLVMWHDDVHVPIT